MSADGRLDPEPLRVEGIRAFGDLEGVAADPTGGLYVLSSQSYSRHGKRPRWRTLFAHLQWHGTGYQVTHHLSLADILDQAISNTLASLGLERGIQKLNIEGLAERDGMLFLGLKAPLDQSDQALIWRLGSPQALFATGKLADARLSLWARIKLDAKAGDATVAGGISELLFPGNDRLLLTSTPSSKSATVESGRLWSIKLPPPRHHETVNWEPESRSPQNVSGTTAGRTQPLAEARSCCCCF